jgi:hypothetical protein
MSLSSEREWRTQPSVSTEKWIAHAKKKLEKGYRLVVSKSRKTANFYLPGKGYEMCDYKTARKLIEVGLVVEVQEHHLGTLYDLVPDYDVLDELIQIREEEEEAKQADELEKSLENMWDEEEETDESEDISIGDDLDNELAEDDTEVDEEA